MPGEIPIGWIPFEIRQQAEQFRSLLGQDLGVYGAAYGILPEGGKGLMVLVVEGMPDEFKEVLNTVVPGVNLSFREVPEPESLS